MARRLLSVWLLNSLTSQPNNAEPDKGLPALALWCQQFSPLTAVDPPDGVFIDITGCAHLFGGEAGLRRQINQRLPGARIAIANTAGAAWALARFGEAGTAAIEPLPLAALRLAPETVVKLRRVGIRQVGQLMRLPRAELTAGYGKAVVLQLDRAMGAAPEPLRFISEPPDWREIEHHAEPIFAPAQLQAALTRLTALLCARLAGAELGITSLVARFYRIDSQCPEICLGFAAPCRDEAHISKLLIEKLAGVDPGFGVEAISLTAAVTEPVTPEQQSTGPAKPDYSRAIDTIFNRLGDKNIWRVAPHPSFVPEFTVKRMAVTAAPTTWARPCQPRPLQLFGSPAAITVIAPVPDDPPVMFTWRGKRHRITHATGPERIAREWWRHEHDNARPEADKIRDYYAVEDSSGAKFWIFRAGTHEGIAPPRWFLHGLFG